MGIILDIYIYISKGSMRDFDDATATICALICFGNFIIKLLWLFKIIPWKRSWFFPSFIYGKKKKTHLFQEKRKRSNFSPRLARAPATQGQPGKSIFLNAEMFCFLLPPPQHVLSAPRVVPLHLQPCCCGDTLVWSRRPWAISKSLSGQGGQDCSSNQTSSLCA